MARLTKLILSIDCLDRTIGWSASATGLKVQNETDEMIAIAAIIVDLEDMCSTIETLGRLGKNSMKIGMLHMPTIPDQLIALNIEAGQHLAPLKDE